MMADIRILYVKRGNIPDGRGLTQGGKSLDHGDQVMIDEKLTLYFTKNVCTQMLSEGIMWVRFLGGSAAA